QLDSLAWTKRPGNLNVSNHCFISLPLLQHTAYCHDFVRNAIRRSGAQQFHHDYPYHAFTGPKSPSGSCPHMAVSQCGSTRSLFCRRRFCSRRVLYDIEDAVAPKDKDFARKNVLNRFASGHTGWVRINGYGSPWGEKDVTELAKYITHELDGPHHNGGLLGVMLAMTESTDHVNETAARLPGVPIVALVETARGLQRINSIAAARGT